MTHWVMFFVPGCAAMGGMFGGKGMLGNINQVFNNPVEIPNGEPLVI